MGTLCVFGDSITWGSWDREMGGWVNRLRNAADELIDAGLSDCWVYNCGICGDRVADVLVRFDVEVAARQPDQLVIAIGINDSPHDGRATPLDLFENQYNKLLEKSVRVTRDVTVIGCTNVNDRPDLSFTNAGIKPYDVIIADAAERYGLVFIDVFGMMTSEDLLGDGLHPRASGHQKLFERVADVLIPAWRERKPNREATM